jgi:hypothetical protein
MRAYRGRVLTRSVGVRVGPKACYNTRNCYSCFPEVRMRRWPVTTVFMLMTALIPALPVQAGQERVARGPLFGPAALRAGRS